MTSRKKIIIENNGDQIDIPLKNYSELFQRKYENIAQQYLYLERKQCDYLLDINYGNDIEFIYNPIDHALELHSDFLNKYCYGNQPILMLGMNPGPWGMSQTGVPFGEVNYVKDYLNIKGNIHQPIKVHPKRPIIGLECERKEVSGDRMWAFLKSLNPDPNCLFKHLFITNYCPLAYLKGSAKNVTPADMKAKERKQLETICDLTLVETIKLLDVKYIIAIGGYVTKQVERVLGTHLLGTEIQVSTLMHPSPINPAANKGWNAIALKHFQDNNLLGFFQT